MRFYQFLRRRLGSVLLLSCMLLVTAGCLEPSFLITPVSGKRALVETELHRDKRFATDKIALIDVDGIILNSSPTKLFSAGEHPVSLLLEQLSKARSDKAVKAVILRINSPGGSVVASELMHNEITHFKKSGKPVIAVMMDVAASGGYYIACACDEIVAQPSTITGSIGVIMQLFDFSKTMEMIGVGSRAITSGKFKDAGSPFRTMKPEEREVFQNIITRMYDEFVRVVAEGRSGLDEDAVRSLADGRIYLASQALELGLIDRIASLREVIDSTKSKIGSDAIRLVAYKRRFEHRPNYYAAAPHPPARANVNIVNVEWPGSVGGDTPRFMYLWRPGL